MFVSLVVRAALLSAPAFAGKGDRPRQRMVEGVLGHGHRAKNPLHHLPVGKRSPSPRNRGEEQDGRVGSGRELAAACAGKDGWADPAPSATIFGNTYFVGTCGITSILVTSPSGHVLIDGGPAEAAPLIIANIRRLGFDPREVRYLLSSHEHFDHAGGLAALKRLTGARFVARAAARRVLESGRSDVADPQGTMLHDFAPLRVDRVIADGGTIRLGGLVFTAHATPGHTAGSTSWSWRGCEAPTSCTTITYADSLSAPAADGYRFTDHPALVAAWRATFAKVAALPCGILVTPHPGASNLFERLAGEAPLQDPNACRVYAESARTRFDRRLTQERAGR